jgi:hypothetical protein
MSIHIPDIVNGAPSEKPKPMANAKSNQTPPTSEEATSTESNAKAAGKPSEKIEEEKKAAIAKNPEEKVKEVVVLKMPDLFANMRLI